MNTTQNDLHWYPGHMTKAKRMMQENSKLIDVLIELLDARIPHSSKNPDIDTLGQGKIRVVILNKADLADPESNRRWTKHLQEQGAYVTEANSKLTTNMKGIHQLIQEASREKKERDRKRGILNRPVRAMVVGIPNVGKSTFINSFAGRACTKTGNKPGVTKGKQWIRINTSLELLDTPGILWPRFDDRTAGRNLALIGSMNDDVIDVGTLAGELARMLADRYPQAMEMRYGATWNTSPSKADVLEAVAKCRNCVTKGEQWDLEKAARLLLDDFRSGSIGRISIEEAPTV
jgi:ribosome biogenesis GTPase A